jgi:hypothetical protein
MLYAKLICQERNERYMNSHNISVCLFPWDPSYGMVFSPPQYRVWLSLIGAPLQAWNRSSIRQMCAPYGYIETIKPYLLLVGQFRSLRVLIITADSTEIPMHFQYREDPCVRIISVSILEWYLLEGNCMMMMVPLATISLATSTGKTEDNQVTLCHTPEIIKQIRGD